MLLARSRQQPNLHKFSTHDEEFAKAPSDLAIADSRDTSRLKCGRRRWANSLRDGRAGARFDSSAGESRIRPSDGFASATGAPMVIVIEDVGGWKEVPSREKDV